MRSRDRLIATVFAVVVWIIAGYVLAPAQPAPGGAGQVLLDLTAAGKLPSGH
jgi:hypothetical protein